MPEAVADWQIVRGPLTENGLQTALTRIADSAGYRLSPSTPRSVEIAQDDRPLAIVRWRPYLPVRTETMGPVAEPDPHLEILIDPVSTAATQIVARILSEVSALARRYSDAEQRQIMSSMPLMERFANPGMGFDGWALIFRDHYVENSVGFLTGALRAGIPAEWIYSLAKGDRTLNRARVHATLTALGIASSVLDNTAINAPGNHASELTRAMKSVDDFIDTAHAAGRRVLIIDDGGLLAQGYGRPDAPRRADAAVELTVSGLKRIAAAGPLGIPLFNMARSKLKTRLGYPEIADSCLRRLRALIPDQKITGRPVLVIGYGALGSGLASSLAAQGCQVHVTDTDTLALIAAAEDGYPTYRSTVDALRTMTPFLIAGTTGSDALAPSDLSLLPGHVYLAPFATRDFSLLAEPGVATSNTEIPGLGREYLLPSGQALIMLGDGRSLNLFEADAIPNQGYDAYRTGTLIAAGALCGTAGSLSPGVHTSIVDEVIAESGLYDAYYDTYLATPRHGEHRASTTAYGEPGIGGKLAGTTACVVGYGVAGRLHAAVLAADGADVAILDPKHQDLPKSYRTFQSEVTELPDSVAATTSLWSVCSPTADHMPVLRAILARNPRARVLLEKPACQAHEIDDLGTLLHTYPDAQLQVIDQYQHSRVLPQLAALIADREPDTAIDRISINFSKDRIADIGRGRFIDRSYGVLGYEWLHMLAVLRHLLTPEEYAAYLSASDADLRPVYDSRLFISSLTEYSSLKRGESALSIELASSIVHAATPDEAPPDDPYAGRHWQRSEQDSGRSRRRAIVHVGDTTFTATFDPVTTVGGWRLARNYHRLTVRRSGTIVHDQVVQDSPLHSAIRHAALTLADEGQATFPDLSPLRRIATIADRLRGGWQRSA